MHRVYQNARKVLVWLGSGDYSVLQAMQMMQNGISTGIAAVPDQQERVASVFRWANLDYFSRTWVQQEFVLAENMIMLYGDLCVSWQAVRNFCLELVDIVSQRKLPLSQTWFNWENTPAYGMIQRRFRQASSRMSLLDLLVENRHTLCSERVDKVYAFLSMASDCRLSEVIRVDYSRKTWQVLLDVLAHANVSPKHTLRYAQFLADLLDVPSVGQGAQSCAATLSKLRTASDSKGMVFPVVAYHTGEVLSVIEEDDDDSDQRTSPKI